MFAAGMTDADVRAEVVRLMHHSAEVELPGPVYVAAYLAGDGFGPVSLTTASRDLEWDWSHVRDSSPAALRRMLEILWRHGFAKIVESPDGPLGVAGMTARDLLYAIGLRHGWARTLDPVLRHGMGPEGSAYRMGFFDGAEWRPAPMTEEEVLGV